jgi:hypothetical protein
MKIKSFLLSYILLVSPMGFAQILDDACLRQTQAQSVAKFPVGRLLHSITLFTGRCSFDKIDIVFHKDQIARTLSRRGT